MSWTEVIIYTVFVLVVIAISLLGVMRTESSGNRLAHDRTGSQPRHEKPVKAKCR